MMKKLSDEFIMAVCHSGSMVITCGFCDKTIFCTYDEGNYDEGELEELRKNAKKNPRKINFNNSRKQ